MYRITEKLNLKITLIIFPAVIENLYKILSKINDNFKTKLYRENGKWESLNKVLNCFQLQKMSIAAFN